MQKETAKILVIRLGAIGDVVHTTNAFRAIKNKYSNVQIHYMTTKIQSCFLENDPQVDKVLVVEKNDFKFKRVFDLAKKVKSENYDIVLNMQPNFKTRFLSFLAGIKKQSIYKKSN